MDHQHKRSAADAGDWRSVTNEIETELFVKRSVVCVRRAAKVQRIAVRCRAYDCLGAQCAAGAASIFDDKWLAKSFRQPLTNQPRKNVGRAARSKADNDANRPVRIGLRPSDAGHGW